MNNTRIYGARAIGLFALMLSGCGGGGGGGSNATQPPAVVTPPPVVERVIFSNQTALAGLTRMFAVATGGSPKETDVMGGGVAAIDFDRDGDIDLYVTGGDAEPNHLYQNQGDGTFVEMAANVGLALTGQGSGPTFADLDADGDLDLFVGAVSGDPIHLMRNDAGQYVDVTATSGLAITATDTLSTAFADYDGDGALDAFFGHWGHPLTADVETLWRNNGDGTFVNASIASGIAGSMFEPSNQADHTFTPNLADIDGDGDLDLLLVSDFDTSQVFANNGDGTFTRTTDRNVIDDKNGMGAAVGDYDNDGDLDWFVSSIFTFDTVTAAISNFGNRLYQNQGDGTFVDATDDANVGNGGWGWGSCFADFDNDGVLDLFHTNGWNQGAGDRDNDYTIDQVRFFHGQTSGLFVEKATDVGLVDRGFGRGVACFDADRDGDHDILITNNGADHLVFYRNDSANAHHYLTVNLDSNGADVTDGIGARVAVTSASGTQIREIRAGSNYVSQNPLEAHFGLGDDTVADVSVRWPDGRVSNANGTAADQVVTISR